MIIDINKLKSVELDNISIGDTIYEDFNSLIRYEVHISFNKNIHEKFIPLVVRFDPNGYFTSNTLIYRDIKNLLK